MKSENGSIRAESDEGVSLPAKPGLYWYSMPDWDGPVPCVVEEHRGELYVRFSNKFMPERMANIPASAKFVSI